MNLSEYQQISTRTLVIKFQQRNHNNFINHISNLSMGLGGECGEVLDYLKKVNYHGHDYDEEKLIYELGDVLWYLSNIAYVYNISLEEVAIKNIEKLKNRYPNGFSIEESRGRKE